MKSNDEFFWQTEGINCYRWETAGTPYHEGMDNIHAIIDLVGDGPIRDVGCGYGRLATLFKPENYIGYDICRAAILKGNRLFPTHKFVHWTDDVSLVPAPTTMFISGPWTIDHESIDSAIETLCENTNAVVIGELMDTTFIEVMEDHNHNVYPRSVEAYDQLLLKRGFARVQTRIHTHIQFQRPFTVARWERTRG
jgi:hypothetical protein